ncbi:MAG: Rrf2 family transcriptional regulator [Roseivirga sp.]|nr:Rrf2 family transcriptional regulator [Roseivirga sp.]
MFSKACQYAIKVMVFIASNQREGNRTGLKEIIAALDSPEAFTAKILQQLVRGGLLESYRGPSGGFVLPQNKPILIFDVVNVIDGKQLIEECVLGLTHCSDETPCPVHDKFSGIRNHLKQTLISTSVSDRSLLAGNFRLKSKKKIEINKDLMIRKS